MDISSFYTVFTGTLADLTCVGRPRARACYLIFVHLLKSVVDKVFLIALEWVAFIDITWVVTGPTPTQMISILVVLLLMKWPLSPRVLEPERWSIAEERTGELITCIQPNQLSEERRNAVASYVQRLITSCISCQVQAFSFVLFYCSSYFHFGIVFGCQVQLCDDQLGLWVVRCYTNTCKHVILIE